MNCNKKCLMCRYCQLVNDPDMCESPYQDDMCIFCSNPNNSYEKEWTSPSQRKIVRQNASHMRAGDGWVLIASMLAPDDLAQKSKVYGNVESEVEM